MYRIQNSNPSSTSEVQYSSPMQSVVNENVELDYLVANLEPPSADAIVHLAEATQAAQDQTYSQLQQAEEPNNMALTCLPSPPSDDSSDTCFNIPHLFSGDLIFPDEGDTLVPELDPASVYFSSVVNIDHLFSPQSQLKPPQGKVSEAP
jgi:hypothetical protein